MRLTLSFLAVSLLFVSVGFAQDQAIRPENNPGKMKTFNLPPADLRGDSQSMFKWERDSADPAGATCYTMRSYLLAPQSPGSNVTRIVGETTCTRSSQFTTKRAKPKGGVRFRPL